MKRSDFIQTMFPLRGKPYSLERYPMFVDVYDCSSAKVLLMTGRQVSKSTYNSRDIVLDMTIYPYFQSLFVCPLKEQTTRFSNNYLGSDINSIPLLCDYFTDRDSVQNVFSRGLNNGSLCQLTYAQQDAERARGIPSDKVTYDEVQDIPVDNLQIIDECLSASEHKLWRYTGTPKTLDNTIEQLWSDSTKCEWIITCEACTKDNIPVDPYIYKMIGKEGPICIHCGKLLNVRKGSWHVLGDEDADITGFHIPQIIMPMHAEPDKSNGNRAWREILRKYRSYGESTFANEILGLSYDYGGRLVTLSELRSLCTGKYYDTYDYDKMNMYPVVAGIDWGISAQTSYTVLTIGSYNAILNKFEVYYVKKYPSMDILDQINDILNTCQAFNVRAIGADMGVGHTNNLILETEYRTYGQIFKYYYSSANFVCQFHPNKGYYVLDKTYSLNLLFMAMKRGHIRFYEESKFMPFFNDILSIYQEMSESSMGIKMYFNHDKNTPDDFVHSLNYAVITAYKLVDHHYLKLATTNESVMELE